MRLDERDGGEYERRLRLEDGGTTDDRLVLGDLTAGAENDRDGADGAEKDRLGAEYDRLGAE